jgi:hypothetical protein
MAYSAKRTISCGRVEGFTGPPTCGAHYATFRSGTRLFFKAMSTSRRNPPARRLGWWGMKARYMNGGLHDQYLRLCLPDGVADHDKNEVHDPTK